MKQAFFALTAAAFLVASGAPRAVFAQGMTALPIDGIGCQSMEGAVLHIHQHLQLFDRGKPVKVPAFIGIPAGGNCLYWLHTHTADGLIHIESPVKRSFTLGQFFDIWGTELSQYAAFTVRANKGRKLVVRVDGHPYTGDPRKITLHNQQEILIENGPPFAKRVTVYDWSRM